MRKVERHRGRGLKSRSYSSIVHRRRATTVLPFTSALNSSALESTSYKARRCLLRGL